MRNHKRKSRPRGGRHHRDVLIPRKITIHCVEDVTGENLYKLIAMVSRGRGPTQTLVPVWLYKELHKAGLA